MLGLRPGEASGMGVIALSLFGFGASLHILRCSAADRHAEERTRRRNLQFCNEASKRECGSEDGKDRRADDGDDLDRRLVLLLARSARVRRLKRPLLAGRLQVFCRRLLGDGRYTYVRQPVSPAKRKKKTSREERNCTYPKRDPVLLGSPSLHLNCSHKSRWTR